MSRKSLKERLAERASDRTAAALITEGLRKGQHIYKPEPGTVVLKSGFVREGSSNTYVILEYRDGGVLLHDLHSGRRHLAAQTELKFVHSSQAEIDKARGIFLHYVDVQRELRVGDIAIYKPVAEEVTIVLVDEDCFRVTGKHGGFYTMRDKLRFVRAGKLITGARTNMIAAGLDPDPEPAAIDEDKGDQVSEIYSPTQVAGVLNRTTICPHCGHKAPASEQISAYPHRYLPRGFSANEQGEVSCTQCVEHNNLTHKYAREHDIYIDHTNKLICTEKEINEMALIEENKTPIKNTGKTMLEGAKLGAQMAVVNKGGDIMLRMARKLAENNQTLSDLLETDEGREIAKLAVATALVGLASYGVLPRGNAAIARIGQLQSASSTFILLTKYGSILENELSALIEMGDQLSLPAETEPARRTREELTPELAEID